LAETDYSAVGINYHHTFARLQIRRINQLKTDLEIQSVPLSIVEASPGRYDPVTSAEIGNNPLTSRSSELRTTVARGAGHSLAGGNRCGHGHRL